MRGPRRTTAPAAFFSTLAAVALRGTSGRTSAGAHLRVTRQSSVRGNYQRLRLGRLQRRLLGSFLRRGQRSRALPRMIGDIEHHAVGSVKFGLVERLHVGWPAREAIGAKLLKLFDISVDIVHQHAEVMDAAEVEARPLVPAEPQDRETDGAVAEEHAIRGALAPGLRPGHFHEIERLLVELGGGVTAFRRKGDASKLRHCCLVHAVWQLVRTTIAPSVTEPRAVAAVNVPAPSRERAQ